jgi:hypothetical protein
MATDAGYVVEGNIISLAQTPVAPNETARSCFEEAIPLPGSKGVIIHARFWPDSSVWEIAERPSTLNKDEWFSRLATLFGDKYEPRAGGRGFFKISSAELAAAKSGRMN